MGVVAEWSNCCGRGEAKVLWLQANRGRFGVAIVA